jgi:predicted nucleic acid-binding protein
MPLSRHLRECVVDASVVIKFYLAEQDSDLAAELLEGGAGTVAAERTAPDLLYLECGNILWQRVRRRALAAPDARAKPTELLALDLTIWDANGLVERALDLALLHDVSVYDGSYLALAELLDIPLVTADEALERKAAGAGVEIVLLSSLR